MENSIEKKKFITTKAEKFYYGLGDAGTNFAWSFVTAFLTLYYTDSVGISASVVGTMMLVSRFFDGFSDIGMSVIIEKTHSKWGKARPWLFIFGIPFALSLVLLMNVPSSFSDSGKTIYMYATYMFMSIICYTMVNLSYNAMLPLISADQNDRGVISVVRSVMAGGTIMLLNLLTPPLLSAFGGDKSQYAWTVVSCLYAAIAFTGLLICVLKIKEKPEITSLQKYREKPRLKESLHAVAKNKYFFMSTGFFILNFIPSGLGGVGIYYARDVLGDANLFGVFTVAGSVTGLVGLLLSPLLFQKIGKRNTCLLSLGISITSCVIALINPSNDALYIAMHAMRMVGVSIIGTALSTFAADITDFGEWKTGIRAEGFASASGSFGLKMGIGLGSALLGWMLSWGGYDGKALVQAPDALGAMVNAALVIPMVCYIVMFILMTFWDMDKKFPIIQKELIERKVKASNENEYNFEAISDTILKS